MYVDNFSQAIYDPDYRKDVEPTPTNWLRLVYDDGTEIDIHLSQIADKPTVSARDALVGRKVGDGGRVFPSQMNAKSTPRLWAAKQQALENQATLTLELISLALPTIMFIISVGIPVGMAALPRAASRRVGGSLASRARPRASNLKDVQGSRVSVVPAREAARTLVRNLRNQKKKVVVNIGGTGAPHEPPNAINLNKQVPGTERSNIPNLVKGPAEEIGALFGPKEVDAVVGFNLSPDAFNWSRVGSGVGKVVRTGGKVDIGFKWPDHKAALALAKALVDSGFDKKSIEILGDAVVRGTKGH